jgi:hypothetical protein
MRAVLVKLDAGTVHLRLESEKVHTEDIAQLVRASVCGTEGRGFETHYSPRS